MQDLIGKKVTVCSTRGDQEQQDVGTLEAFDGTILKLRKSEKEVMYFSIYMVRLVKPF